MKIRVLVAVAEHAMLDHADELLEGVMGRGKGKKALPGERARDGAELNRRGSKKRQGAGIFEDATKETRDLGPDREGRALLANASGLAIAHNHPSGSAQPSEEDKLFTRRIHLACDILGLKLVDSLVVAEDPSGLCWTSILARASTWT